MTSPSVEKWLSLVPNIFITLTATTTKHQVLKGLEESFQKIYAFTPLSPFVSEIEVFE